MYVHHSVSLNIACGCGTHPTIIEVRRELTAIRTGEYEGIDEANLLHLIVKQQPRCCTMKYSLACFTLLLLG